MPNLELHRPHEVSNFRKIAIGTWATTYDPSVYGSMEVVADPMLDYIARFRAATGKKLTISHVMAKVMAAALKRVPDANAVLRFNKVYRRKVIGVFFQVAMTDEGDGKADLSGATLYGVDEMSIETIFDDFVSKVTTVRERKDPALEKTRATFQLVPALLLNAFVKMISLFSFTLNLDLRWAGLPEDPFGSIMITNVGSMGLDVAYAPLVPYSKVPIVMALSAVKKKPIVVDDEIVVRSMLGINATFDHRLIDGFHAALISKVIRAHFEDPDTHLGPIPQP